MDNVGVEFSIGFLEPRCSLGSTWSSCVFSRVFYAFYDHPPYLWPSSCFHLCINGFKSDVWSTLLPAVSYPLAWLVSLRLITLPQWPSKMSSEEVTNQTGLKGRWRPSLPSSPLLSNVDLSTRVLFPQQSHQCLLPEPSSHIPLPLCLPFPPPQGLFMSEFSQVNRKSCLTMTGCCNQTP